MAAFLEDVGPAAANKVAKHMKGMPSKALTQSSGQLASEALTVALNVADAAKEGFDREPGLRDRTVQTMSQLVSFLGSVFIDTANSSVGASSGQLINRARVVNVEVPNNRSNTADVWVVNRGAGTVTAARVGAISEPGKLEVSSHEPTVSIGPRGRAKITLTVKDRSGQANSEAYALLVVEQIGSIVIRARVV